MVSKGSDLVGRFKLLKTALLKLMHNVVRVDEKLHLWITFLLVIYLYSYTYTIRFVIFNFDYNSCINETKYIVLFIIDDCYPELQSVGSSPTKEDIQKAGDHCPICHDVYSSPMLLQCRHIFCESCVTTWFDREQTCPLCRARIVDDPSWRDGSTTLFVQLF